MDKFNDLISIVTASYNYEDYIKETIESVIAQSYQNWELIIVDDGSKDNSINVINEYCQKDSRIKLYTHENNSNKGLAQTLQYGIKLSSGKYVAFLESDDTITPDCLEKKANVISENPIVIPHCLPVRPLSTTLNAAFPNSIISICRASSQRVIKGKKKFLFILTNILKLSSSTLALI